MLTNNEYNIHLDKQLTNKNNKIKKTRVRSVFNLEQFYFDDLDTIEIGADEAGRGPLFGRVYSAAVILPKDNSFDHFRMKDSKKFH